VVNPFLVQAATEQATFSIPSVTGIGPFDNVLALLQTFGFFRVVLPFLLVFAVIYAILMKTGVLGDKDKGSTKTISAIVGLVFGFFFIAYTPVVNAIAILLPQASFLLILVVLIMMVISLLGFKFEDTFGKPGAWMWGIAIIIILIFVAIAGFALGPSVPALYWFSQLAAGTIALDIPAETQAFLIALAIIIGFIGVILYAVTKSD
jgi:hypothetical protein